MGVPRMTGIWDGLYGPIEVRRVQPYEAIKQYVCPGCGRDIPPWDGSLRVRAE